MWWPPRLETIQGVFPCPCLHLVPKAAILGESSVSASTSPASCSQRLQLRYNCPTQTRGFSQNSKVGATRIHARRSLIFPATPRRRSSCFSGNKAAEKRNRLSPTFASLQRLFVLTVLKQALGTEDPCPSLVEPCACAGVKSCAWAVVATGSGRCISVPESVVAVRVDCNLCAFQSGCPGYTCEAEPDACACSGSSADCFWNVAARICEDRGDRPTQSGCNPPLITAYSPLPASTQRGDRRLVISITFSTDIHFVQQFSPVASFWCDGQVSPAEVPYDKVSMYTSPPRLIVDVSTIVGVMNHDSRRDCGLILKEGAISDANDVPFPGLKRGDYKFTLDDVVAPSVVVFNPQNGDSSVTVDSGVVLTFSEPFRLSDPVPTASLSRLDEQDSQTSAGTVAIPMRPPHVTVDATRLRIDLTGKAQPRTLYSLSLPAGCIVDSSGNQFIGLPWRQYVFRMAAPNLRLPVDSGSGTGSKVGVIIGVVLGILILGALIGAAAFQFLGIRRRYSNYLTKEPIGGSRFFVKPSVVRPAGSVPRTSGGPDVTAMPSNPNLRSAATAPSAENFGDTWGSGTWGSTGRTSTTSTTPTSAPPGHPSFQSGGIPDNKPAPTADEAQRRWNSAFNKAGAAEAFKAASRNSASNRSQSEPAPGKFGNGAASNDSKEKAKAPVEPQPKNTSKTPEVANAERRLQNLMSRPLLERKKVLKEMMLEFHPDKNSEPHAKEVFQYINNAKGWFLADSK